MILGVDHIAIETKHFDKALACLEEIGFDAAFVERDLPNPVEKRPFLAEYKPTHSIALFKRKGSVAIELTYHGKLVRSRESHSLLATVQCEMPYDAQTVTGYRQLQEQFSEPLPRVWTDETLPVQFLEVDPNDDSAKPGVVGAAFSTCRFDDSLVFLTSGLGWRHKESFVRGAFLDRPAPIQEWSLTVGLVDVAMYGARKADHFLDIPAWTCIAMVSTDIEGDAAHLRKCGATETTEPFELSVGGKRLLIVLVRGPDGEIVELIQLQ